MASPVTLGSMKTQARERSDMMHSKFIGESELSSYINASIKELYDRLIDAGEFYFVSTQEIDITANQGLYDLNSDFYKLLGVDLVVDAQGNGVSLKPFQFEERNAYLYTPSWNVVGLSYLRYMLQGNKLKLLPTPNGGNKIKVWYCPIFSSMSADTDSFDGINGWEEYVVIDAAIKMMIKEESDPSALMAQKQAMIERIETMKQRRDIGSPSKIANVNKTIPWEFWSFDFSP